MAAKPAPVTAYEKTKPRLACARVRIYLLYTFYNKPSRLARRFPSFRTKIFPQNPGKKDGSRSTKKGPPRNISGAAPSLPRFQQQNRKRGKCSIKFSSAVERLCGVAELRKRFADVRDLCVGIVDVPGEIRVDAERYRLTDSFTLGRVDRERYRVVHL